MYFCDAALYFQHHYSSLQCHMIFRNHSNILIYDQETFLIIINVENSCTTQYFFVETVIHLIFKDPLMNRKFKRTAFIIIKCYY